MDTSKGASEQHATSQVRSWVRGQPNRSSVDHIVETAVDAMLLWGGAATLAYWFVLLVRLPAWWWYPVCSAGIALSFRFRRRERIGFQRSGLGAIGAIIAICVFAATINIFTNRPDSDDIAFSHRAVVAAENLSRPIAQTDTALDPSGLPPLTPFHIFTSVEVTTAFVARILNLPQVWAIHMGLGTLVNFMLPAVYFLLLRFFGCRTRAALWGTFAVVAFFAISGNVHRDWGTFTILRSWQGKCILVELIIPLALLYALRFGEYGRRADLLRLHAATCCGIGLSSSGIFLVPFVIAVGSLSVGLWKLNEPRVLARLGAASTIVTLPAFASVLPWLGALPPLGDISFYVDGGWPTNAWDNLGMVVYPGALPLYALYLGIAAWTLRTKATTRLLLTYLALVAFILLVPGVRDVVMAVVKPGAFWRLAYTLLVPLWFGLAVAGCLSIGATLPSAAEKCLRIAMLAAVCVPTVLMKHSAIDRSVLAMPGLKFPRADLPGIFLLSQALPQHAVVLADWQTVTSLGLLRPDLRFISTRPTETVIAFSNDGRKAEGEFRAAVQVALSSCDFAAVDTKTALARLPHVSVVAFPSSCPVQTVRHAFGLDDTWREISGVGHTALLKETKPAATIAPPIKPR